MTGRPLAAIRSLAATRGLAVTQALSRLVRRATRPVGSRVVPLADARSLGGLVLRTRVLRLALAAALAAVVVAAALVARHPNTTSHSYLRPGSDGLIVLDLSASISTDTFTQIGTVLSQLASSGGRFGLVVFSSDAYEALPPGTPARELAPIARYFHVQPGGNGFAPSFPLNPWTQSFSEGTSISRGLDLALTIAQRDRLVSPALLLISDLDDDPGDLRRVTVSALALRRAKIPVHVVSLSASDANQQLFAKLLGPKGSLEAAPTPGAQPSSVHTAFPDWLVASVLLAAVLLAAAELLAPTLRIGEGRPVRTEAEWDDARETTTPERVAA